MLIQALMLALAIVLSGGEVYAAPTIPENDALTRARTLDVRRIEEVCARNHNKCAVEAADTELIIDFDYPFPTSTSLFREILDTLKVLESPDSLSIEPFSRYVLKNINMPEPLRLDAATIDLPLMVRDSVFGVNGCGSLHRRGLLRRQAMGLSIDEWNDLGLATHELNSVGVSIFDLHSGEIEALGLSSIYAKFMTRQCITDSSAALLITILEFDTSTISRSVVFQDSSFFGGFKVVGSRVSGDFEFVGVNFYGPVTLQDNQISGRLRFANNTFFRNLSIESSHINRGLTFASNTHAVDIDQPVLCPQDGSSSVAMLHISLTTTEGLVRVVGSKFLQGRPSVAQTLDLFDDDKKPCQFVGRGITILGSRAEQGIILRHNEFGCLNCHDSESTAVILQSIAAGIVDVRNNYLGQFFALQYNNLSQLAASNNVFVGGVYILNNFVDGGIAFARNNSNLLAGKTRIEGNKVGGELTIAPAKPSEGSEAPRIEEAGDQVPATISGNQVGGNLALRWWDEQGGRPSWLNLRWNRVGGKLELTKEKEKGEMGDVASMGGCVEGGGELKRFVDLSYTTAGTLVWKMPIDCQHGWSGLGLSFTQWQDERFQQVTELSDGSGGGVGPEEEIKAMEDWRTTIRGNGSGGAPEIDFLGGYLEKLSHRTKGREWVGDAKEIDHRPDPPGWLAPGWKTINGAVGGVWSQRPEWLGAVFSGMGTMGSWISSQVLFLMSVVVYLYLLPSDFGTQPQLALALYVVTIFVFAVIYNYRRFERSSSGERDQSTEELSLREIQTRFENGGMRLRGVDALMYSVDAAIPIVSLRMLDRYELLDKKGLRHLQQVLALWFGTAFLSAITIL